MVSGGADNILGFFLGGGSIGIGICRVVSSDMYSLYTHNFCFINTHKNVLYFLGIYFM